MLDFLKTEQLKPLLVLKLGRLAIWRHNVEVRELTALCRSMPVFLPWRNQDNISHANGYVFFFRSNYAFSFSDDEYPRLLPSCVYVLHLDLSDWDAI